MSKLPNSLVDIFVKVGLNEKTGLIPVSIQPEAPNDHENELYTTAFEPQILAAISSDAAVFPQDENIRDENYPPKDKKAVRLREKQMQEDKQSSNLSSNQNFERKGIHRKLINRFSTKDRKSTVFGDSDKQIRPGNNRFISGYNKNNLDNSGYNHYTPPSEIQEETESVYPNLTVVSNGKGPQNQHPNGNHLTPTVTEPRGNRSGVLYSPSLNRSLRKSFRSVDFAKKSGSLEGSDKKIKRDDLPLSSEDLNSLTSMCFPDGAYCYSTTPKSTLHFLVLTDIHGTKSYAICLTFYRQYTVEPEDDNANSWRCTECHSAQSPEPSTDNTPLFNVEGDDRFLCYLPSCYVVISKYPYYTLLKDCLSRLLGRLNEDIENETYLIKDFALLMTRIPVPPSGNLLMQFSYQANVFTIRPQESHDRGVIDFSLELLFQHFSTDKVLLILNCLLLQQRIVFMGSHFSALTVICESFLHLLYPFRWQFTFVPILSWSILELVEAPGTFIMGCHSRHREMIEQVEDIVLVSIDEGGVSFIGEVEVPRIPQYYADSFLNACQRTLEKNNSSITKLEGCTTFTYEDVKEEEHRQQQQFNSAILTICLELMVDLFRNPVQHIRADKRFFNKEKFLSSVEDEEHCFYTQVISTELFNAFLKDRMSQKQDQWTFMEEKQRTLYRNPVHNSSFDLLNGRRASRIQKCTLTKSRSLASNDLGVSTSDLTRLGTSNVDPMSVKLPEFYYFSYGTFFKDCLEIMQRYYESCTTSVGRAQLSYLLGMMSYADGKKVEALRQFQRLESCDSRLLPVKLIRNITLALSEGEKNDLHKDSIVFRSTMRRQEKERGNGNARPMSVIMHFNKIPNVEMELKMFTDTVQYLEIAMDQDTITRLFKALLLLDAGTRPKVLPDVFEAFYKSWKEGEVKCQDINSEVEHHLESGECVLKISETVKTTFGMGRIGLTQKRLFYMREGPNSYKEVASLRDIKFVDKVENKSFFSTLQALKVEIKGKDRNANNKPFIAVLKDNRDLWYNIIRETWYGKLSSEEVRDPSVIQLAAQNVLIVDAFMQCILEVKQLYHFINWTEKISSLCYYSERKEENAYGLSEDTKEALQHRVDPNLCEHERLTIECMVYTPGNRSEGGDYDTDPKLWCALSSGKIRIFDASTWIMDMVYIQANSKVANMLLVGLNSIWMACFDHEIYIIDIRTKSSNQALKAHNDAVADLTKNADDSVVYSCSLNNEIIAWDTASFHYKTIVSDRNRSSHFRKLLCHNEYLFCGTKEEILVYTTRGELLQTLAHHDTPKNQTCMSPGSMPVQLDCYVITQNSEIWIGCGRKGTVLVYDLCTLELKKQIHVNDVCGIGRMVQVKNKIWVGTKDGKLLIYDIISHEQNKVLSGHKANIRSMCAALDRYVITGSGSHEGKIMIWRTSTVYN